MYVELGSMENSGIRSMTFGVYWDKALVPIAKIEEFGSKFNAAEISQYVKKNTIERFGPVRTIKPHFVYELIFDGITKSSRRKSGLMLTNPQIFRKVGSDPKRANTLNDLKAFIGN